MLQIYIHIHYYRKITVEESDYSEISESNITVSAAFNTTFIHDPAVFLKLIKDMTLSGTSLEPHHFVVYSNGQTSCL